VSGDGRLDPHDRLLFCVEPNPTAGCSGGVSSSCSLACGFPFDPTGAKSLHLKVFSA